MEILIVDDHDLFAEGLKLLIEDLNEQANFTLSANFNDGLQKLRAAPTDKPFGLVLLDYKLPDAPSDSIAQFCASAASTPIIVISSEDTRDIISLAINAGAAGYIPKSSSKEVLINALDHVLRGGTFLPKQVLEDYDQDGMNANISKLTRQQHKIISYVVKGASNKVIANQLSIAEGTVKAHLHNAFKILGVKNRTEAVLAVAKHKITFDD